MHYDPASHAKAALVTADMLLGGPQTPRNVKTTEGVAALCAVLLMIAIIAILARRLSAS